MKYYSPVFKKKYDVKHNQRIRWTCPKCGLCLLEKFDGQEKCIRCDNMNRGKNDCK